MLTLGSTESSWGTQVKDLPPSLGKYEGFGNFTTNSTASAFRNRAVRFGSAPTHDPLFAKTGDSYWAEEG